MLDQRTIRPQRARDIFRLIAENEYAGRIGTEIEKPACFGQGLRQIDAFGIERDFGVAARRALGDESLRIPD